MSSRANKNHISHLSTAETFISLCLSVSLSLAYWYKNSIWIQVFIHQPHPIDKIKNKSSWVINSSLPLSYFSLKCCHPLILQLWTIQILSSCTKMAVFVNSANYVEERLQMEKVRKRKATLKHFLLQIIYTPAAPPLSFQLPKGSLKYLLWTSSSWFWLICLFTNDSDT